MNRQIKCIKVCCKISWVFTCSSQSSHHKTYQSYHLLHLIPIWFPNVTLKMFPIRIVLLLDLVQLETEVNKNLIQVYHGKKEITLMPKHKINVISEWNNRRISMIMTYIYINTAIEYHIMALVYFILFMCDQSENYKWQYIYMYK